MKRTCTKIVVFITFSNSFLVHVAPNICRRLCSERSVLRLMCVSGGVSYSSKYAARKPAFTD